MAKQEHHQRLASQGRVQTQRPGKYAASLPTKFQAYTGPHQARHEPDYQMQLMLLEQQNKKRLLMARQEQESIAASQDRRQAPICGENTLKPHDNCQASTGPDQAYDDERSQKRQCISRPTADHVRGSAASNGGVGSYSKHLKELKSDCLSMCSTTLHPLSTSRVNHAQGPTSGYQHLQHPSESGLLLTKDSGAMSSTQFRQGEQPMMMYGPSKPFYSHRKLPDPTSSLSSCFMHDQSGSRIESLRARDQLLEIQDPHHAPVSDTEWDFCDLSPSPDGSLLQMTNSNTSCAKSAGFQLLNRPTQVHNEQYTLQVGHARSRHPSGFFAQRRCLACEESHALVTLIRLPCGYHCYCGPCFQKFCTSSLKSAVSFPPRCCGQSLPADFLRQHLPVALFVDFEAKSVEYSTKEKTYCHRSACSAFIVPQNIADRAAVCPACDAKTCAGCKAAFHVGQCLETEEDALKQLAQLRGWQRCPSCKVRVEKLDGCDHMSCLCGAHFCYLCGESNDAQEDCMCYRQGGRPLHLSEDELRDHRVHEADDCYVRLGADEQDLDTSCSYCSEPALGRRPLCGVCGVVVCEHCKTQESGPSEPLTIVEETSEG